MITYLPKQLKIKSYYQDNFLKELVTEKFSNILAGLYTTTSCFLWVKKIVNLFNMGSTHKFID